MTQKEVGGHSGEGRGANPLPGALCCAPLQAGSPSLSPNRSLVLSSPFTFLLPFLSFLLPPLTPSQIVPAFPQVCPAAQAEARNLHRETHRPPPAPPLDTHGHMCPELFLAAAEAVSGETGLRSLSQVPWETLHPTHSIDSRNSLLPESSTPGILPGPIQGLYLDKRPPYN